MLFTVITDRISHLNLLPFWDTHIMLKNNSDYSHLVFCTCGVLRVTWVPSFQAYSFCLNKDTLKCHSIKEEQQHTFFSIKRWQCITNKASNQPHSKQAQANIYRLLSLTEVLPVLLDSLQADTPRCVMAAYVPHSSHIQIPVDLHIWNTYIRHPRHSSLSSLKPQAMYLGNCSRWWKSWASLSHLQQKEC